MNAVKKIAGTILFLMLSAFLIYLILIPADSYSISKIEKIKVTGSSFLSSNDYIEFVKLNFSEYSTKLNIIKDRFEKHPYVKKVEIQINDGEASFKITERNIKAIIIKDNQPYFITEDFKVLPIVNDSLSTNFPVINNFVYKGKVKLFDTLKCADIVNAFKIIDAAEVLNHDIKSKLSEINMNRGKEAVITFSGLSSLFLIGKGNEVKKMYYLNSIWDGFNKSNLFNNSEYIDLRYSNAVFAGNIISTGLSE
ncbi:MAG TPA: hypothetical protein VFF33_12425 [Ignavibacteriaceae bacterium]|nr:hypothetical protein [Ignavibacteriaceae bacterium]